MYEKDYILRFATQAARAVARILGLKKAGQYQEALALVDRTLQEEVGPSAALVDELSAGELIALLKFGAVLNIEKALLLAALLKEEGDIFAGEGKTVESRRTYTKGLQVALEALDEADETTCRRHLPLIEGLIDPLGQSEIDSDTRSGLFEYYQKIGEPAKARRYFSGLRG